MLALRLLGSPVLLADGRTVPLAIRKTWALLVQLAVAGPMLRARLCARLWPDLDESSARRNLRRELARLRDLGAAGLLRAEGDLLALDEGVDVDLRHFQAALDQRRSADAVACYRGPLADGVQPEDTPDFDLWLFAERDRLRASWRSALEALAQAAEFAGDGATALGHLGQLLDDDPLTERHHAAVMRLHAAGGRREEALAQYERCRALLQAELGLQPMADTEALAATLRGAVPVAAGPARAPVAPATLLPAALPFVGRVAEVESLEAAWRSGCAVVIEGEGGVGKSRLALDFAAAHGPYALARCRPGDVEAPYASFTRALRVLAGPTPMLDGVARWVVDEVARLLPELGSPPPPISSAEQRSRFFEACTQVWQALAGESFDAVVLDDWHCADLASRTLLAFVAQRRRELGGSGAREFLLLRPELDAEASAALQTLCDATGALRMRLSPLDDGAVLEMLRRLSGAADPVRFASRLQAATAGNPFFLAETLRHLAETRLLAAGADGVWHTPFDDATQDYRELPVPASVREAVLARAQRLPEGCRRVLEAAALAAEPFAPALLAPACALTELDTVWAIEQAVRAQLLREHEAGGFAFAHDLVQQALQGSLPAERRRLMHRRLALAAEASGASAGVVASHHESSGDLLRAVPWRMAAGDYALRLQAWPEAVQQWQAALADGATPGQALQAHKGLMRVARLRGEIDTMLAHGEALQDLAAQTPGPELTPDERSDALIAAADNLAFSNRAAQALALLDSLADLLPDALQGQRLLARTRALQALGRVDEASAVARAVLALPALLPATRVDTYVLLMVAEFDAGRLQLARECADAAYALSVRSGNDGGMCRALFVRGMVSLAAGDLIEAEADLQQAAAACASRGFLYLQRQVLYNLSLVYQARSEPDQALATVQHGWDLRPPLQANDLRVMYRLAFVDAHNAKGDLGLAWQHAAAAIEEVLAQDEPFTILAAANCTLELLGLLDERGLARRLLAAVATHSVNELRQASPEVWVATAQFELSQGEVAAARHALAAVEDPAEIDDVRVRVRHALAAAELRLADGDAVTALTLLPANDTPGMNDEMRIRGLALRVRAEMGTGALSAATAQAALQTLDAPSPYALATLELHTALARARRSGTPGAPDGALGERDRFVAGLAGSLQAHSAQQAAFEGRCA